MYKRIFDIENQLDEGMFLFGARQVGKSTLLQERFPDAVYYDLLIDLTTHPMLPLRYLAMYADADFKVGLNLGEGIHDMLLSLPDLTPEQGEELSVEATWLYDQIMKYLTTIKSND